MTEQGPIEVSLEMAETATDDSTEKEATQTEGEQPPTSEISLDGEELPPLTYIDFSPQCLGSQIEGKEPEFALFGTVVEQANQWLRSMPQFLVVKCETVAIKLGHDFSLDNDQTVFHSSSNGKNVYLRTLRLWLSPKSDTSLPVQQLAYITVLPDHSSGDVTGLLNSLVGATQPTVGEGNVPAFDSLTVTVEKLNKHLQTKPLSGRIMTLETLTYKCQESGTVDKLDLESTCWSETGINSKLFVNALRLFYVVGQPAFETIGVYDQAPEMLQNRDGMGLRVKFATFGQTISRASHWLQSQKSIRVVNIQSINMKLEKKYGTGPWILEPTVAGYIENQSLAEARYCKVIRIAYVQEQKQETPMPYDTMCLTSRLFVPNRVEGRKFETFSKTMMRVIKWLNATRMPVFACETVKYQVSLLDSTGQPFNEDRCDCVVNSYHGQHFVTCIRLYFPSIFQEPPPEVAPPEDQTWASWGCVVS